MVDDGAQLTESNDYPFELLRSALVPGHVEHAARFAVCCPVLLGPLVARLVDDLLLALALA
eukprot:2149668-Lingulodinium_polyedra.AAC.1